MSLEAALQANTEALNRLAGLLANGAQLAAPAAVEAPARETKAKASAEEPAKSEPETPKNDGKAEAISYEKQVAPAITKVHQQRGRDKTLELLATFNVKNGKDLRPEQYADVVKACETALAEVA